MKINKASIRFRVLGCVRVAPCECEEGSLLFLRFMRLASLALCDRLSTCNATQNPKILNLPFLALCHYFYNSVCECANIQDSRCKVCCHAVL